MEYDDNVACWPVVANSKNQLKAHLLLNAAEHHLKPVLRTKKLSKREKMSNEFIVYNVPF